MFVIVFNFFLKYNIKFGPLHQPLQKQKYYFDNYKQLLLFRAAVA